MLENLPPCDVIKLHYCDSSGLDHSVMKIARNATNEKCKNKSTYAVPGSCSERNVGVRMATRTFFRTEMIRIKLIRIWKHLRVSVEVVQING